MLNTIRELGVKISLAFDATKVEQVNKAVDNIANKMKAMGFAVGAAAGTIFGLTEAAAMNARDLKMQSDQLGVNTERLQELGYAAKLAAGVSRDELTGALEGVAGMIDKVKMGSPEATASLNRLGLQGDVLKKITEGGLSVDQVMGLVADRIKDLHDPIAKASIATEIFGGAGVKLLPLLNQGSAGMAKLGKEARNYGLIFSEKEIQRQAKFQENLIRMSERLQHMALVIGAKLMPIVAKVLTQFDHWFTKNQKFITSGITKFIEGLSEVIGGVADVILMAADGFIKLSEVLGGPKNTAKDLLGVFLAFKTLQIAASVMDIATAFGGFAVALAPLAAWVAGLSSMVAIVHDLWELLHGKSLSETWLGQIGQGFYDKVKAVTGKDLNIGDKIYDYLHPQTAVAGAAAGGGVASAAPVTTNANVTLNVAVPPGTSAAAATDIVSSGVSDGLEQVLRMTSDQVSGGKK